MYIYACVYVATYLYVQIIVYVHSYVYNVYICLPFYSLHKQLSEEDYSYNYAKQVLERHHKTLTKRKAALKKAEVELDRDLKRLNSSRYSKAVQDIQTSLHDVRT